MHCEGLVTAEFRRVLAELGCAAGALERDSHGGGEGSLTHWSAAAYCKADWGDRGSLFTLFLGRTWEISGRRFACEFAVEALSDGQPRKHLQAADLEDQVREQFEFLARFGGPWLKGDFSQEPYIEHRVFPLPERPVPADTRAAPVARSAHIERPEAFLMTVQGGVLLRCSVEFEGGVKAAWTAASSSGEGRVELAASDERVFPVRSPEADIRRAVGLIARSADFERRKAPKGAGFDIHWSPSAGFIVLAAAGSGPDRRLERFDFGPGELPRDLLTLLGVLEYERVREAIDRGLP